MVYEMEAFFKMNKTAVIEPIRVLIVIPGDGRKSINPFSHRQSDSLECEKVEVKRFFLKSRTAIKVVLSEMRRFRQKIASYNPHIVHAHFGTVTSCFCALGTSKPLIITFHGSDLNPAPGDNTFRHKISHLLSQLSAIKAKRIICVSKRLKERLWLGKTKTSVIPVGMNVELLKPKSKLSTRQSLGWQMDQPIVLFNARTDPVGKRLDLAEETIKIVQEYYPTTRLEVLRGQIPPDNMPLYYNAVDCLLMTSDYEGSPMVVKEAMACNLPIVSVDVGDVHERLVGVTPSSITVRNATDLAEAVIKILHLGIRSNGRKVIENISEQKIAHQIIEIYLNSC